MWDIAWRKPIRAFILTAYLSLCSSYVPVCQQFYSRLSLHSNVLISKHEKISLCRSLALSSSKQESDHKDNDVHYSRRDIFKESSRSIAASLAFAGVLGVRPEQSMAEIVDETLKYGGTDRDSAYSNLVTTDTPLPVFNQSESVATDEFDITIPYSAFRPSTDENANSGSKPILGIELGELIFRTNRRIFIQSIAPSSIASEYKIQKNWVLVSINGESTERTDRKGVQIMVKQAIEAKGDLKFRFREPGSFQSQIRDLENSSDGTVTTQIAPAGDTTQRRQDGSVKFFEKEREQTDQKLSVSQLKPPLLCNRKADVDDLLEISYTGTVLETGKLFDGSTININGGGSVPGRAGDITVFFVLGKQPFGQFPPGWDVGLMGMCVGERRRIIVPPVLGYGSAGVPRRGIPPDATLVYDVSLISMNGLATPQ